MKHVKDVLGKGWELYAEGQKLQSKSTTFWKKLNTKLPKVDVFALSMVFLAYLHFFLSFSRGSQGSLCKYEHTALFHLKKCVVTTLEEVRENYKISISINI